MKTRIITSTIKERIVWYQSHADFTRTCIIEGIVPKGFQLKWEMQLDTDSVMRDMCAKI